MTVLATVHDIEVRLGRELAGADLSRVVGLLEDASDLVRLEAGVLGDNAWLLDSDGELRPIPTSVRGVVRRMVDRAIRNPEGFSAESDGDYSYQRTQVQPGLYLTDSEKAILRKACGRTGLWTQPLTRGDDYCNTIWYEDQFGCELFPLDVYYPGY
jgi:hypothetical protein